MIGGIAAEIEGNPYGQLEMQDINPGKISIAFGGVGRNITENLARLGEDVSFVSVTGDDFAGRGAVGALRELGAKVDKVKFLADENTGIHLSILNLLRDLELALGNMDIMDRISTDVIDDAVKEFADCKIIGLDANPPVETLVYAVDAFGDIPLFLDPISIAKSESLKNIVGKFHTIKPNRREAEALSGLNILSEPELEAAGKWFLEQGVKRVFITLSGGGVYYTDGTQSGTLRPKVNKVVNAAGAGDAFSAAILSGFVKGYDMHATAEYGMAAAAIALESQAAVNPKMSLERIENIKSI